MKFDEALLARIGGCGAQADIANLIRYVAGCFVRERERLARQLQGKVDEQVLKAILDDSEDEKVFKWKGPETSLDAPPPTRD